jgi:hypothetical protein
MNSSSDSPTESAGALEAALTNAFAGTCLAGATEFVAQPAKIKMARAAAAMWVGKALRTFGCIGAIDITFVNKRYRGPGRTCRVVREIKPQHAADKIERLFVG